MFAVPETDKVIQVKGWIGEGRREGGAVWDTKIWDCWIFVWLHLDFGKIIENHINGQQHGVDTFVGHHREVLKNFHGYCFSMGLGQPTIQALDSPRKKHLSYRNRMTLRRLPAPCLALPCRACQEREKSPIHEAQWKAFRAEFVLESTYS